MSNDLVLVGAGKGSLVRRLPITPEAQFAGTVSAEKA